MKCKKDKKNSWVVFGIITGFLFGFSYFAIGVYTHSQEKTHPIAANINSNHPHSGTIR